MRKCHNLEELDVSSTRELEELEENIVEAGETATVIGTLAMTFDPASEILCAGLDDRYKRYMPTHVTWRDATQECFSRDYESCNMGSLEDSLNDGLIKLKASFNPMISKLIGEPDLPVNKLLFKASEYAYKLRK